MSGSPTMLPPARECRRALFPNFTSDRMPGDVAARPSDGEGDDPAEHEASLRERALREALDHAAREGQTAAYAEWRGRLAELAAALEGAAAELAVRRTALTEELDRQLPRLVMLVARKVIAREVSRDDTTTARAIRALAERLTGGEPVLTVRLAARSAHAFEAWRRAAEVEPPVLRAVSIESDPGLAPGDWIVETRDGFWDGRLESQLDEAWRLVAEASA